MTETREPYQAGRQYDPARSGALHSALVECIEDFLRANPDTLLTEVTAALDTVRAGYTSGAYPLAPATIRRLAELAFDYAGAETAYHQDQANTEALNIARDPEQYRQWGQVVDHVARGLITTIDQAQQALARAAEGKG